MVFALKLQCVSIDSGRDDEVLEIALLACTCSASFTKAEKEEIKKKDVGA